MDRPRQEFLTIASPDRESMVPADAPLVRRGHRGDFASPVSTLSRLCVRHSASLVAANSSVSFDVDSEVSITEERARTLLIGRECVRERAFVRQHSLVSESQSISEPTSSQQTTRAISVGANVRDRSREECTAMRATRVTMCTHRRPPLSRKNLQLSSASSITFNIAIDCTSSHHFHHFVFTS